MSSLSHSPRTRRTLVTLATATLLATTGCSALESSDEIKVAAGFYPLAFVAERVGGEHVDVTNLTRPGKDAHGGELSLQATAALSEADLVIVNGGFQAEIDASVASNVTAPVLDVAKILDFLPVEDAHDHGDAEEHDDHTGHDHAEHDDHTDHAGHDHGDGETGHEGHDHGDTDPHFWLDPLLMATYAEALADDLAEIDPDNAGDYRTSAATLVDELTALDTEYVEGLAQCRTSTVVVSHDAFGYLKRYGLTFEPVAGLSPGAEPTPADLKHLSEVIEKEKITVVFTETLAPSALTEQLAADASIASDILDPVEGLVDAGSDDDYFSLMRSNLAALMKANAC